MHRITLNIYLGALPLSQQSSWFYLACCSCHVQTALQMAFARAVWYSSLHRSEHSFVLLRKPHSTMTAVHGLSRKTRYSELPFAVRVLDGDEMLLDALRQGFTTGGSGVIKYLRSVDILG